MRQISGPNVICITDRADYYYYFFFYCKYWQMWVVKCSPAGSRFLPPATVVGTFSPSCHQCQSLEQWTFSGRVAAVWERPFVSLKRKHEQHFGGAHLRLCISGTGRAFSSLLLVLFLVLVLFLARRRQKMPHSSGGSALVALRSSLVVWRGWTTSSRQQVARDWRWKTDATVVHQWSLLQSSAQEFAS